jgi:uncharacterized repeat protein (TIGR01451 family)
VLALGASGLLAPLSAPAQAAVFGTLNLTGSVTFSATSTDFLAAAPGPGTVLAETFAPQTGTFAGVGGTTGSLFDYTTATAPVGVPIALSPFLALAPLPAILFDLTFVQPGVFGAADCGAPAAAGQSCTPPGTAFNFVNTSATSSVLSFTWAGTVDDGSADPASPFVATVTTQFTGMSYQQVLATLFGAGGVVSGAFSATFQVTTGVVEADLEITKTDGVGIVDPGGSVTYAIVVTNPGPANAIEAPVTDDFPPSLENVSWTCTASPGSLCGDADGTGDLATTVTLLAGGTATFVATADVAADATGTVENTATVGAGVGVPDLDTSNNSATDTDVVRVLFYEIPTLGGAGLAALIVLLATSALLLLRRRAT